jgi:hypothetical protein
VWEGSNGQLESALRCGWFVELEGSSEGVLKMLLERRRCRWLRLV